METDGKFPADRTEAVLSAIYYALTLFAASQGVKYDDITFNAGDVRATRPRLWTREEIGKIEEARREREDNETRRLFAPLIARAKAEERKKREVKQ